MRLRILSGVLLLCGCPGDDTPADDSGTTTGVTITVGAVDSSGSDDGVTSTSAGSDDAGSSDADSSGGPAATCGNGIVEGDEVCDEGGATATCDDDCTIVLCGDGVTNTAAGEVCDDRDETATCDDDCTAVECGDGNTNQAAGEICDDGGPSLGCDVDCTFTECGDGVPNPLAGEDCDEGLDSPTCDPDCTAVECGDGVINTAAGEDCDEIGQTALCDADCTAAECGDGVFNAAADEECDDAGESPTCDPDCTLAECGDGVLNTTAGETCDDGVATVTCDPDCTPPLCGDGVVNVPAGEQCDDGNAIPDDGCTGCMWDIGVGVCSLGADTLATSPGGNMIVCDDPTNTTCEEDMETLCPGGWGLCTRLQHINRNAGFNYPVGGGTVVVGEIYCRGAGAAGHYTLGPYDGVTNLDQDPPINCGYGSSRPVCPSAFGCNELSAQTLCCAPTPTCGNGVVDGVEEECDDGNFDETDDCLNSCSWRVPTAHGITGVGC